MLNLFNSPKGRRTLSIIIFAVYIVLTHLEELFIFRPGYSSAQGWIRAMVLCAISISIILSEIDLHGKWVFITTQLLVAFSVIVQGGQDGNLLFWYPEGGSIVAGALFAIPTIAFIGEYLYQKLSCYMHD